ncbi:PREDICTED: coiled-coil domain-containing protein R3HCC1L isoform X2 [Camelina sativa]|uniref:Coiled-coil domain-containing protein R3HCC1L isoform X2 n=1 Tax=Camelina sativa TaxID=90675 RepID=A0ABM0VDB3_CAMSA|nr:PREDICTED: coiled-coil domain-containing protein R3HCC1L isoform X2 [Camelina sativa]
METTRLNEPNWSERVEDLVAAGDVTAAISFLESLVTNLQSRLGSSSSGERTEFGLQLASALTQLADLYSSLGLSLKSDELRTRSSLIKQRALDCDFASSSGSDDVENQIIASNGLKSDSNVSPPDGITKDSTKVSSNNSAAHDSSDDDWEALADLEPSKLLHVEELPEISKLSVEEPKVQGPKRRGRGTFTYKRDVMYSDRDFCESRFDDLEDNDVSRDSEKTDEALKSKYGTRHVLVLAGFSPSLRTTDLEKLFKDLKDSKFIIRWVNDTTALAVFKTPSAALEACNHVQCSFTIRVLDDHDSLLGSISGKDLEPPSQRPKTSARTAQRLIAHSMGLKLPASGFGSKELRDQEAARKNRIVSRQKQREDAWGDD